MKKNLSQAIERQFKSLVENYILPLFPGAEIAQSANVDVPEKGKKLCAILKGNTSMAIRRDLSSSPIVIKRSQPFSGEDSSIIESFVRMINKFQQQNKIGILYQEVISKRCLEMSILDVLSQGYPKILFYVTNILEYWQNRTYEGNSCWILQRR